MFYHFNTNFLSGNLSFYAYIIHFHSTYILFLIISNFVFSISKNIGCYFRQNLISSQAKLPYRFRRPKQNLVSQIDSSFYKVNSIWPFLAGINDVKSFGNPQIWL